MSELIEQPEDMGPFKGGRPLKFTDPAALHQAITAYFDMCDPHLVERLVETGVNQNNETIWMTRKIMTHQKPYTISGLARAIGMSRTTLLKYEDPSSYPEEIPETDRQAIMDSLSEARYRVEEFAESNLYSPYANGAKFALINNYKGWADKVVQEHEGGFFDKPQRVEVELVNAEVPAEDEAETEPDPEPGTPPTT